MIVSSRIRHVPAEMCMKMAMGMSVTALRVAVRMRMHRQGCRRGHCPQLSAIDRNVSLAAPRPSRINTIATMNSRLKPNRTGTFSLKKMIAVPTANTVTE